MKRQEGENEELWGCGQNFKEKGLGRDKMGSHGMEPTRD